MKQFENNLQAKAHVKRIQNAKPTLLGSKYRPSETKSTPFLSQVELMLHLYQLGEFQSIPIYKLLKPVSLQQYTRELIVRGYGVNIGRLTLLSDKQRQSLYDQIKVLPGHSVKLNKIIQSLIQLTQNNESSYSCDSLSSVKHSKRSSRNTDIEFEDELSKAINHYAKDTKNPQSEKAESSKVLGSSKRNFKKQKSIESIRVKLPQIERQEQSNKILFEKKKSSEISTIRQDYKKPISKQLYKRNSDIMSKTTLKSSSNIKPSLPPTTKSLSNQKRVERAPIEINLEMDKVRKRLLSVDGALMTSTIVNVDLEQICFCISTYLQRIIKQPERKPLQQSQSMSQSQRSEEKEEQTEDLDLEDVGNILRESYLHPLYKKDGPQKDYEEDMDQPEGDNLSEGEVEEQIQENTQGARTGPLQQSFLFGNSSVSFGLTNSLDIFQEPYPTEVDYYVPTTDCLTNFIKNIIVSAKMQREIPVLSLLYVIKFITRSQLQLTSLNYKRVLISCILLASKIWDDQSFQTPSFSHTFPDYSTVLLNQLQKQILIGINYQLKLNKKEYALLYYQIRQYKKSNIKSFQNRLLSLQKVMQLQKGVTKSYRCDHFQKRKSF